MLTTAAGAPIQPLALAAYPGQSPDCVRAAFEAGLNLFFFYSQSQLKVMADLPGLLDEVGPRVSVATGSGSRSPKGLHRVFRTLTKPLGRDTVDIFFAEYINPHDGHDTIFGDDGVLATLAAWRDEGRIRYVGASTHDGDIGQALASDARVDVLMLRYNMAHRRVGGAVFPIAGRNGVTVVAFTATRWGTLLRGHDEWTGPVPTAADCYRFCLAEPVVGTVLTAPKTTDELAANLAALYADQLRADTMAQWHEYGDVVHGPGRHRFDTEWP